MSRKKGLAAIVLAALLAVAVSGGSVLAEVPPLGNPGTLVVHKFEDLNGNGAFDVGEPPVSGIPIHVWQFDTVLIKVAEGMTGADGTVVFEGLAAPTRYKVWEPLMECWEPTNLPGGPWKDGRYMLAWTVSDAVVDVYVGNRYICTPPPPPCPPAKVTLIAGQHYDAGIVTVSNDAEYLYVDVATANGWTLLDTSLYVGTAPPTKSAPGQLGYSNGVHYQIPLEGLAECGDPLYIALHANVVKDGQQETAWSQGTDFGKGWAMYFAYEVCCEYSPEE